MASLPLAIAKKRFGCLLGVNRKITALRDICDDPEKQEQDRGSTATARLEEAWNKYEDRQRDILGLTAETEVEDEQATFNEMEEIYKAVIDGPKKVIIKAELRKLRQQLEEKTEQLSETREELEKV